MPIKTYPNKITFRNNKEQGQKEKSDETVDFALKMKNAIDVELIDTNLYSSKELWLPFGSRGAFGGQVIIE
jgi:acyl-CoA thioesterase